MRYPTDFNTFIPKATGQVLSFRVNDDGTLTLCRTGEPDVSLSHEDAVALLGFDPAEHAGPVRRNEYVQIPKGCDRDA